MTLNHAFNHSLFRNLLTSKRQGCLLSSLLLYFYFTCLRMILSNYCFISNTCAIMHIESGVFLLSDTKKQIVIIPSAVLLILFGILSVTTKMFVFRAISHIYLSLLFVPIIIKLIQKCFKDQLPNSMKKVLVLCGGAIVVDLVIAGGVRYILREGISTVLFLPACLPLCFMIILFYSCKDIRRGRREKILTFLIGIPWLLLSLYFEILSFIQI